MKLHYELGVGAKKIQARAAVILSVAAILVSGVGVTLAAFGTANAAPSDKGFNGFGYNYQANIFNGTGESWSVSKGLPNNYLGIYSKDKLIMKWNDEWARGNEEDWSKPPYQAWEDNEWNGKVKGGSGAVWHYKIVWVGPQVWNVAGMYTFHINFSGHDYDYDVELTQNGDVVTGTLTDNYLPAQYDKVLPVSGTVTGDNVVLNVTYPDGYWGVRTFDGSIDGVGLLGGTWLDDGADKAFGNWSATGNAVLTEGPYWKEGGERIWDQFETIMDHGVDPSIGQGHIWYTHALPNGFGSVKM